MSLLELNTLVTQAYSVRLLSHYQYMIPSCLWLGCWWVGCRWLWYLHWHSTKLFVCEELDTQHRHQWLTLATYSDSNGSYDALEVFSGCGCPCAHQATIFLSLTDCPRPLVGTLLRPLPLTAIGIQCWYPSSTPWNCASWCVSTRTLHWHICQDLTVA